MFALFMPLHATLVAARDTLATLTPPYVASPTVQNCLVSVA